MKRIKIWGGFGKGKKIRQLKEEKDVLVQTINDLEEQIKNNYNKMWKQLSEISEIRDKKIALQNEFDKLNKQFIEFKEKATTEKKALKAEIKDLKKKLEESMSDKYIRVPVRSGRTPKGQTAKLKTSVSTKNNVRNYMKNELER